MAQRKPKRGNQQIMNAVLAVGSTIDARWEWFVGLCERDLSELTAAESAAFAAEVDVFSLIVVEDAKGPVRHEPPAPTDLPAIQRVAREILRHLRRGNEIPGWLYFKNARTWPALWVSRGREPGEMIVSSMVHSEAAVDMFTAAAISTLVRLNRKLRLCLDAQCGKPFVAKRSNQRYCSTRCQSRTGFANWVERAKGGREKFAATRSREYFDRRAAKLGPGAAKLKRPKK